MRTRLLTSFGIVFVLALGFVLKVFVSNYFFDAIILAIACVSAYELSKMFTKMGRYNDKIMACAFPVVAMAILLIGIYGDKNLGVMFTIGITAMFILLCFGVTFVIPLITYKSTLNEIKTRKLEKPSVLRYSLVKALNTSIIFVYPSFLVIFLSLINHFEDMSGTFSGIAGYNGWVSFYLMLFALLVPIFTDTFAYLVGGIFGGKKLAPKISPNKTIAGAVGGFAFAVLLSLVVFYIFDAIPTMSVMLASVGITFWKVIIISAIGSIISQLGDLFESYLKRRAGVKDSGTFLPGHGGMLDRFDSYIFVAPYLFIAFSIIFALI